jgi:hypothetical protein
MYADGARTGVTPIRDPAVAVDLRERRGVGENRTRFEGCFGRTAPTSRYRLEDEPGSYGLPAV